MSSQDIPRGDAQDNDYVSRPGQKEAGIPVQSDDAPVEDPIDPETADSDEQLEVRDDNEAIDESNIIEGKTRGAKPSGSYREPGDEEGLPGPEDGTSST
ncbi:hypothetical protein MBM_06454 [Drepanopeziza brunnea f. sp. 'multigermtubi' MB_m1]|uniref:Histone chaperone domain-containing protein n=1 Tax=Marssonina brunnea f. sp. multigermtubi (strain MB_m1) TaxID=1072389 RepID=K1X3G0_MARBU|nr:uncharacterized protein MBM_06454 [Drepanopeziza brunnea f. sp. 'multigermtubi' MB_m1]EKD15238.1 hypothetical protein MBM_06454 [Drepanopeziza brunnea f. sp. 'multigermtubi' MB_m1]